MLIFDFDGVICDSFEAVILALHSFGLDLNNLKQQNMDLRCLETIEIFRAFKGDDREIPSIVNQLQRKLRSQMTSLKPAPGIQAVLKKMHEFGLNMGIVTSNTKENVIYFLDKHDMNFFDFIYSGTLFNKGDTLKKVIQGTDFKKNEIFYIGDETRDIIASREAGVCPIAVSWGFNAKEVLIKHNPEYLIETPNELLELFIGNNAIVKNSPNTV